jgi:hypothetical protein
MRRYVDAALRVMLNPFGPGKRTAIASGLAQQGDWAQLLAFTADVEPSQGRLLVLRLKAAIQLKDRDSITKIVALAAGGHIDRTDALAVAAELLDHAHDVDAWQVYATLLHSDAGVSRGTLKQVVLRATDPAVQEEAEAILQALDELRQATERHDDEAVADYAQLCQAVDRLAAAADWAGVLQSTKAIKPSNSRLIVLRVVAAIELKDDDAVASIVDLCLTPAVDPRVVLTVAARLIGDNRTEVAWRLLENLPPQPHRTQRALLKRLTVKAAEAYVRTAAQSLLFSLETMHADAPAGVRKSHGTAAALEPPYAFAPPTCPNEDAGQGFGLSIINLGRVAETNESEYRREMLRFEEKIAAPEAARVVEHKDVLVNRLGQIWRRDGTLIRTAEHPLPQDWSTRDVESVAEAVLCTNYTRGLYHWYAERLPSLAWRLAPGAPTPPILIGSHSASFQDDTLRLLGVPADQIIRIDDVFHCDRVLVAEMPFARLAQWSCYGFLYENLVASARAEAASNGVRFPKRIYISRRDSTRRPLTNEAELEAALKELGVEPLIFSTMPLSAQIAVISEADLVIGPHGAGLTHILAHKSGMQVLELQPVQTGKHFLRLTMARLSRLRGHHHTLWLEPGNPVTQEWSVDTAAFIGKTKQMLADLAA